MSYLPPLLCIKEIIPLKSIYNMCNRCLVMCKTTCYTAIKQETSNVR